MIRINKHTGWGIGYRITSEIIKHHGESISVKSEKGKKTNFTFTLTIFSEK